MKWNEAIKGKQWESKPYMVKRGDNQTGAMKPSNMDDVFHCYHDGGYIGQSKSLDDAQQFCADYKTAAGNA